MLLDVMETCNSTALSTILPIFKRMFTLIQIIAPILLILMTIIQFVSMINKPDEKTNMKKLINKIVAAVIIFIVPVFVNGIMGLVGESTEFSKCWLSVDGSLTFGNSNYVNVYDDKEPTVIVGDKDYNPSNPKSEDNNDNSNGNTNSSTTISKIIFIGDSRTVGMYAYKTGDWSNGDYSKGGAHEVDGDIFIAETGKGLDWLKSIGIPAANSYMGSGSALVILMGVNDTSNIDGYISYLKSNVSSWTSTGTKVYFASIGPCEGKYKSNNTQIISFNSKLQNNLPSGIGFIDLYSYLNTNGFSTSDGLHYQKDTSLAIYNYIKSTV